MSPPSTSTELHLQFGAVRDAASRGLVRLLALLPQLCDERFLACDLLMDVGADRCTCRVRLAGPVPPEVVARLRYWTWQLGGVTSGEAGAALAGGSRHAAPLASSCDWMARNVAADGLASAARSLAERLAIPAHLAPTDLSLHVALGPPRGDGLRFTRQDLTLFVPSPMALPVGDRVVVHLHCEGRPSLAAEAVVTAQQRAGQFGVGTPDGMVLGLVCPERPVVERLEAETTHPPDVVRRRTPRYAACVAAAVFLREAGPSGGARLEGRRVSAGPERLTGGYVENLSQGGAFVNTARRLPEGTAIRLELTFPDGEVISAAGSVSHARAQGIGVRFEPEGAEEAAIARAVRRVAAMRPRALVVDDDRLARLMLSDALAARGFTVFAAHDVASGLAVLTDELLALDLLVTDLHLPGADGEQLIRTIREAGGEQDLAILAVSGDVDAALERRLQLAGADAVVSKADGTDGVQEAATRAFLMRARRRSARAGRRPDRFAALA